MSKLWSGSRWGIRRAPTIMTRFKRLGIVATAVLLAGSVAGAAFAADAPLPGFYGGITVRDSGVQQDVAMGDPGNFGRFGSALGDARTAQTVVFGGYRWRNDLALEAALDSVEGYRLPGRGGVGLVIPGGDETAKTWKIDLYGSWAIRRSFSLYGRLGYAHADAPAVYSTSIATAPGDRRFREGLNYGVGLRYDLTRSLGLQLEYARVGQNPSDAGAIMLPDGDQVQFGLKYRF